MASRHKIFVPDEMKTLPLVCSICDTSMSLKEYAEHQPGKVQEAGAFVNSFNGMTAICVEVAEKKPACLCRCTFCNKEVKAKNLQHHFNQECDQIMCPFEEQNYKMSMTQGIRCILPPNSFMNLGNVDSEAGTCDFITGTLKASKQHAKVCPLRKNRTTLINKAKRLCRMRPKSPYASPRVGPIIFASKPFPSQK